MAPPAHHDTPVLLIIDMVKDNFDERRELPITAPAREIVAPINNLAGGFRTHGWPVVFSTDAFHRDDFFFTSRMKPHSLAGTDGAAIMDGLDYRQEDLWLPKPRFSAFFRTDLHRWLRRREVTLCAVAGIATNFCVLATALDALCHDFKAVLLEDCTAAVSPEIQKSTLELYRRNPLYPLFQVTPSEQLMAVLTGETPNRAAGT